MAVTGRRVVGGPAYVAAVGFVQSAFSQVWSGISSSTRPETGDGAVESATDPALETLRHRYASGEIDVEEHRTRNALLREYLRLKRHFATGPDHEGTK